MQAIEKLRQAVDVMSVFGSAYTKAQAALQDLADYEAGDPR